MFSLFAFPARRAGNKNKFFQFKKGVMHFFKLTIICITMLFVGYQLALVKATLDYIFGNKMCKPNTFYLLVYISIIRSVDLIEYFYINLFHSS
jgi:hypothetical protein